jgi:hypothetical protein
MLITQPENITGLFICQETRKEDIIIASFGQIDTLHHFQYSKIFLMCLSIYCQLPGAYTE